MWQWFNACARRVPEGKSLLRINMDETSVCLFQGGGKGNIIFKKRRDRAEAEPVERASRAKRRCCLTHVAFICDRPDIQPLLPQVLVGNEATIPAGRLPGLRAAAPPNVHLVRQKSAWNNQHLMVHILALLAAALQPLFPELHPVLLLDACRVHIPAAVLRRCFALRIWPVIIPAKLTWLMQPLDTHGFLRYKTELRKAYQEARTRAALPELSLDEFLECLYLTIRKVLQGRPWDAAFDADGFGHNQERLSDFIKRKLAIAEPLAISPEPPTEEQLQLCFPKRAAVPHEVLLRPLRAVPKPAALPSVPVGRRLALGPRVPPASLPVAAGALPKLASFLSLPPPATTFAGREPRTRSEHRIAEALAKGRPVPKSRAP